MRIVRLDPADEGVARACHAVHVAAQQADDPVEPPQSPRVFRAWLLNGWEGNPGEVWGVPGEAAGQVVAWYRIELPDLENRDRASVTPVVQPAFRRRGTGRELLRHSARRAAASGRSILGSAAIQDSPGAAFAGRVGLKPGLIEARRILDLRKVTPGRFAELRETAAEKAAGYTLASWSGVTPDEQLGRVAEALNALNDAPRDEGYEDDVWDARRVRERADGFLRLSGMRGYSIAALQDGSGEMAALTQVYVDPENPGWGFQGLTAVTRPHRGHRLGLLTKTAMLQWLAAAEPQLERIETGNAASNSYMIAVNETLGFELAEPGWQFYQLPVAEVCQGGLPMGIRIMRWDPGDTATAVACYQAHLAAHLADEPHEPPASAGTFGTQLAEMFEHSPGEVWYVPGARHGSVAAYYQLGMPDLENRNRASVNPVVRPEDRRRGIGRELLRHAAARAADHGRAVLDGGVLSDSAGEAFARRIGATLSLEDVRRVQDLRKIPPGKIAGLRAEAARKSAGYSLVTWTGPVPDERCGQVAEVINAFNDAPRGPGVEDARWDAERVRKRTGSLLRAGHLRGYSVAAIADSTGEMAGFTEVMIDPGHPEWGYQQLTAVTRPHRGRRLGLLVKTAMLQWLAAAEPKLERIATGNAAANEHMIAVNETLGYEVVEPGYRCYELPVTAVR